MKLFSSNRRKLFFVWILLRLPERHERSRGWIMAAFTSYEYRMAAHGGITRRQIGQF